MVFVSLLLGIATKASLLGADGVRPARRRLAQIGRVTLIAILLTGADSGFAQTSVHRFGAITSQPNRTISLELLGNAPSAFLKYFDLYPFEASTNLADWTPLTTLVRANVATNALVYLDAEALGFGHRCYRTPTNHFFTALAKPSGPYAVGRATRMLTDASRTNRYGIATNSSFMITIWYPAEPVPGILPGAYIEPQLAVPLAEAHVGSSGDNASRLAGFFAFSLPNVPVASVGSPYPVVIYSHGYSFHRQESSEKLEELASHGFVAVAMDHMDCRTTVYPNGKAVRGIFTDSLTPLIVDTAVADRLADDRFVLEALPQFNASDPLLAGRLDHNRLGAMGWSLGNSDLGELAQTDDRFKGIVMLEGYLQGAPSLLDQLLQQGLRLPLLGLYQEDLSLAPTFDQAITNATQDTYFSLMHITSHFAFKDLTEVGLATDSVRGGASAMRACVLSFFNRYLKGQDDHLLDNPTNRFPVLFNYVRH